MKAEELLFAMLRSVVCDQAPDETLRAACTSEKLAEVFELASGHDLGHLVGQAIAAWKLPEQESFKLGKRAAMVALYRYNQLEVVSTRLYRVFEEAEIPFIPLKGAVLRYSYPQPWMRTSCDIDVLVPIEKLEEAAALLVEKLSYKRGGKGDHDWSMYAPGGLHVELHYSAVDEGRFPAAQKLLKKIWDYSTPAKGCTYRRVLTDEMFYFFHIAHMAKHFEMGGCGIRPFLDLWILNHRVEHSTQARRRLLQQGEMARFALAAEKLCEHWFSGTPMDEMTARFERYILDGGVYGTLSGTVTVQQAQKQSRAGYVLGKIFLPYSTLKYQYPILQKHKWLFPVYQFVRWTKLLFKGGIKRSVKQLQVSASLSKAQQDEMQGLLEYVGL